MRFKEILEASMLAEMIVRFRSGYPDFIIAFKDSIWVIDEGGRDEFDEILPEITKVTGKIFPHESGYGPRDIQDYRQDILVARYDDDRSSMEIETRGTGLNPATSILVQKVVKQLGIQKVITDVDGMTNEVPRYEIRGKLPEYGYHGTSWFRLRQILKLGIVPQDSGNWGQIHTENTVFFAVDDKVPRFHASRTARNDNDVPVVIKFRIPDQNRLIADYDVAYEFYGKSDPHLPSKYKNSGMGDLPMSSSSNFHNPMTAYHKRPQNLWKNSGIFGYEGRIPPSAFVGFYSTFMPTHDDRDIAELEFYELSREEMNDYMKAYVWIAENIGLSPEEFMSDNWLNYSGEDIIAEYSDHDEDDDENR